MYVKNDNKPHWIYASDFVRNDVEDYIDHASLLYV